jgi:hypothetical protein
MNLRIILLSFFTLVMADTVMAQSKRREAYDSLLVGDRITPAVSTVMMPKSYTEVIVNSMLLSTNSFFDANRDKINMDYRSSSSITTLQVTHGISSSGRFNIGLDLAYRIGRTDGDPDSSPLKVFSSESDGLIEYERAFTSIAARVRYVPTRNKNFVIQQAFSVPIASSTEGEYLGDNRYALNNQFLYTQLLGRKFFLFGQLDVLIRFEDDKYSTDYTVPLNIYASYLLNNHIFPFVRLGMLNVWGEDIDGSAQSFNYGFGLQYQFNSMFNINAFYTDSFSGKNLYDVASVNLGVRVVF